MEVNFKPGDRVVYTLDEGRHMPATVVRATSNERVTIKPDKCPTARSVMAENLTLMSEWVRKEQ